MSLNMVTLEWDLADLVQAGVPVTVSLVPTAVLTDATDGLVIGEVVRKVTSPGGTGQLPGIIACDNGQLTPAGWAYTITVTTAAGQVLLSFAAFINHADGAVQNLASLTPVFDAVTMQGYLPLSAVTSSAAQPAALPAGAIWIQEN